MLAQDLTIKMFAKNLRNNVRQLLDNNYMPECPNIRCTCIKTYEEETNTVVPGKINEHKNFIPAHRKITKRTRCCVCSTDVLHPIEDMYPLVTQYY